MQMAQRKAVSAFVADELPAEVTPPYVLMLKVLEGMFEEFRSSKKDPRMVTIGDLLLSNERAREISRKLCMFVVPGTYERPIALGAERCERVEVSKTDCDMAARDVESAHVVRCTAHDITMDRTLRQFYAVGPSKCISTKRTTDSYLLS